MTKAIILQKLKSLIIVLNLKNQKKPKNNKQLNLQKQKTTKKMINNIKRQSPNSDQKFNKLTTKNPI
jgi:hypothetical protein